MVLVLRSIQAETLRFSIGLHALLLGALLLIAPHQFDPPTGIGLHPRALVQGVSLVLGGLVLLTAGLSRLPRAVMIAGHLGVAVPIVMTAVGLVAAGVWHGAAINLVVAGWTLFAAAVPVSDTDARLPSLSAFALMMGTAHVVFGSVVL